MNIKCKELETEIKAKLNDLKSNGAFSYLTEEQLINISIKFLQLTAIDNLEDRLIEIRDNLQDISNVIQV